jgi:hypothetical protein
MAALVTLHTARFITQTGHFNTRRENDAVHNNGDIVMTGGALYSSANGGRSIHDASFAAIRANPVKIARRAVTASASRGHFLGIILVPMNESFIFDGIVRRIRPHFLERNGIYSTFKHDLNYSCHLYLRSRYFHFHFTGDLRARHFYFHNSCHFNGFLAASSQGQ